MAASTSAAQQRWELENAVASTSASEADALYKYDPQEQQTIQQQKPWQKDPQYFKHVRMSALALLKMAIHARSGGNLEVMGLMQGKVQGDTFVVIDSFALPVEGTETRVNAQCCTCSALGSIKFFHALSYPILSPRRRLMSTWWTSWTAQRWAGRVWIRYSEWIEGWSGVEGADWQALTAPGRGVNRRPRLRADGTYPEGYKPPDEGPSEYQTIPLSKIEDFGVHANQYYSLDITFFKSSLDAALLDLLWNSYWVNTLSASPLVGNREYTAGGISDVAEKLEQAESTLSQGSRMGRFAGAGAAGKKGAAGDEGPLAKICRDVGKLSAEQFREFAWAQQLYRQRLVYGAAAEATEKSYPKYPAAALRELVRQSKHPHNLEPLLLTLARPANADTRKRFGEVAGELVLIERALSGEVICEDLQVVVGDRVQLAADGMLYPDKDTQALRLAAGAPEGAGGEGGGDAGGGGGGGGDPFVVDPFERLKLLSAACQALYLSGAGTDAAPAVFSCAGRTLADAQRLPKPPPALAAAGGAALLARATDAAAAALLAARAGGGGGSGAAADAAGGEGDEKTLEEEKAAAGELSYEGNWSNYLEAGYSGPLVASAAPAVLAYAGALLQLLRHAGGGGGAWPVAAALAELAGGEGLAADVASALQAGHEGAAPAVVGLPAFAALAAATFARRCDECGKRQAGGAPLKRCSACTRAFYCRLPGPAATRPTASRCSWQRPATSRLEAPGPPSELASVGLHVFAAGARGLRGAKASAGACGSGVTFSHQIGESNCGAWRCNPGNVLVLSPDCTFRTRGGTCNCAGSVTSDGKSWVTSDCRATSGMLRLAGNLLRWGGGRIPGYAPEGARLNGQSFRVIWGDNKCSFSTWERAQGGGGGGWYSGGDTNIFQDNSMSQTNNFWNPPTSSSTSSNSDNGNRPSQGGANTNTNTNININLPPPINNQYTNNFVNNGNSVGGGNGDSGGNGNSGGDGNNGDSGNWPYQNNMETYGGSSGGNPNLLGAPNQGAQAVPKPGGCTLKLLAAFNVRAAPCARSNALAAANSGAVYPGFQQVGSSCNEGFGYAKVRLSSGVTGYIGVGASPQSFTSSC
ncbi:MAG: hypothetical protein J3K34DRAFT_460709 [Monoraphidium minutum]|nr:MAG: hypothetical protein J3K34DRAFT_460709 [Monoraphidium minutum]